MYVSIRSAVAGNNSVEDMFLEEGGIFVLMNLLQVRERPTPYY